MSEQASRLAAWCAAVTDGADPYRASEDHSFDADQFEADIKAVIGELGEQLRINRVLAEKFADLAEKLKKCLDRENQTVSAFETDPETGLMRMSAAGKAAIAKQRAESAAWWAERDKGKADKA